MNTHTDCVSYEILRREAQASMDPTDPAFEMYSNKMEMKMQSKGEEKTHKRERPVNLRKSHRYTIRQGRAEGPLARETGLK